MITSERMNLSDMRYDIIIVDEGHKTKNRNTEFRRNLSKLRVKGHRLILTGTPLQNNLDELWSVFDFVQPKILGKYEAFQRNFSEVIKKGLMKDASLSEKTKATNMSQKLRKIY
jgi:SNF2 family DNA or RNA helicase